MIDLREIRETIEEIRRNGTTVGQAEKLALLYIAADHMEREEENREESATVEHGYSIATPGRESDRIAIEATSEFLQVCNGAKIEDVLKVMDEHMQAIFVLYPKEHDKILKRIENSK